MFESKNNLRKQIKTIFRAKTKDELDSESQIILSRLEKTDEFIAANTVALYHSLADEPSTHSFIEKWAEKKKIFLPVVRGESMFLAPYIKDSGLTLGDFSILEPELKTGCDISSVDLVVVPAVAYDSCGNRLGRGRGYYDKFFAQYPTLKRIGLCFSYALVESVPALEHDVKVDKIISSL